MRLSEVPESFHVLVLAGTNFFIDTGTRREIEAFLSDGSTVANDSITVDSIGGEEILVVLRSIEAIYSSTPVARRTDREIRAMCEQEENLS